MFTGINKEALSQKSQKIYSNLFSIMGKKLTKEIKILVLGGFYSFSKFIAEHHETV